MFIDLQLHATFLSRLIANAARERISPPPVLINLDGDRWVVDRIEVLVPGQGDAPAWCSRFLGVPAAGGSASSSVQLIQRVRVRFAPVSRLGEKPLPVEQTRWVDLFLPVELSIEVPARGSGGLDLEARIAEIEVPAPPGEKLRVLWDLPVRALFGLDGEALGSCASGWEPIIAAALIEQLSQRADALLAGLRIDQHLPVDPKAFLAPMGETGATTISRVELAPDRDGLSMVLRMNLSPDPWPGSAPDPSLDSAALRPLPPGLMWSVSLDGRLVSKMVQVQVAAGIASQKRTTQRTPVSIQLSDIPDGALQPYWAEAVKAVPPLGTPGPAGGPRRGVAIHVDVGVTATTWQGWCQIDVDVHSDMHLFGAGQSLVTLAKSDDSKDGWDLFGCFWVSIAAGGIAGFAIGGPIGLAVGAVVGLVNAVVLFVGEAIDRKGPDGTGDPAGLPGGWSLSPAPQSLPFGMTLDDLRWDSTADRLLLGGSAQLSAKVASAELSLEAVTWSPRNACQPNTDLWAGYTLSVHHAGRGTWGVPVSGVWLIDPASVTGQSASPETSTGAIMPLLADEQGTPAYSLRNLSAPRSFTGEEPLVIEIAGTDPLQGYHAVDGLVFTGAGAMRFQAPAVPAFGAEAIDGLRRWLASPEQRRFCDTIHHRNKFSRRRLRLLPEDPSWRGPLLWRIAVRGEGPWDKPNVVDAGGEVFSFGDHLVVLTEGKEAGIGLRGAKGAEGAPLDVMVGRLKLRERLHLGAPIQRMALSQRGTRLDVQVNGETQRFSLHGPAAVRTRVAALEWPAQQTREAAAPPAHGNQRRPTGDSRARALRWGQDVIGFRQLIAVKSSDQVLDLYSMDEVSPQHIQWSDG